MRLVGIRAKVLISELTKNLDLIIIEEVHRSQFSKEPIYLKSKIINF